MVQNVRGQTLIDAIVQVFQEAPGARPMTAGEVARHLRDRGFWGGKEPKSPEQVVESHLATRHAGMFEAGGNGTFALKPVYFRPAARSAALAAALAAAATRGESSPPNCAPAASKPDPATPARSAPRVRNTNVGRPTKKRRIFGKASVAYITPPELGRDVAGEAIGLHLTFEEALKLHAGLARMLAHLACDRGAGERMAAIRVRLSKRTIAVCAHRPQPRQGEEPTILPELADWGVEPE